MGETRCACALEGRIQKKTNWKVDNVEEKDAELKPWVDGKGPEAGVRTGFWGSMAGLSGGTGGKAE